jgi:hypothetical protein
MCISTYIFTIRRAVPGFHLAGRNLTEILRDVLDLLENCPARCDRSCESCLRHYHNQHLKDRLDRFIGAQLLRYAMTVAIPPEFSIATQASNLDRLAGLLQLDGFRCTPVAEIGGQTVRFWLNATASVLSSARNPPWSPPIGLGIHLRRWSTEGGCEVAY